MVIYKNQYGKPNEELNIDELLSERRRLIGYINDSKPKDIKEELYLKSSAQKVYEVYLKEFEVLIAKKLGMISPELYHEQIKNKSIEVLYDLKKGIEVKIKVIEDIKNNPSKSSPSKDELEVELNINKQYLKEINSLIKEKALFFKDLDKYKGCLIGGAIGDALGYPIEFIRSFESIKNIYGEKGITRFKLNDEKAVISDDTQMTLYTAVGLIWGNTRYHLKGMSPNPTQCIYLAYQDWYNTQVSDKNIDKFKISWIANLPELNVTRAPGTTCLEALESNQMGTLENPINDSKGCGGLMRVAPIGLYWGSNDIVNETDYIKNLICVGNEAAQAAALTHGHPLGIIPAYVFAIIISILANNSKTTIEEAYNLAMKIYKDNFSKKYNKKDNELFINLMEKAITLAHQDINDMDAIFELGQGWVAEEALAIALYSCVKYSNDFEKAIVCAVNHDGDSDSTGSIAGNIMGAYLGIKIIPRYYTENLELRDVILEIAEDLYVDCPVSELNYENNDKYWLSKYLYIKAENVLTSTEDETIKVVEETKYNNEADFNNLIFEIFKKIVELPFESETTIANLINYEPQKAFVEPLMQGKIYNSVLEACKKHNIDLEENRDDIGGLAYYYVFKKVDKNDKIVEDENDFEFLNKKIEKLTKELAEAYRNNDQELITKLQTKIQEATDKQLKKDVDKLVKEDLKREQEYIKQNLDKEKIKEQQKVIDDINKRLVANLVETWSMSTPEFKTLKKELSVAISKMECYKKGIYDEEEITKIYNDGQKLEAEILGKNYTNRETLLSKLGYVFGDRDKRKKYATEKEFMLDELKTIREELESNGDLEQTYIPCVRAKRCINEFIYHLDRNEFLACLDDIYEVIESDKNDIYNPFNKDYKYLIFIGNEEKSIILNMVNRLEAKLTENPNIYSLENLFEKAEKEINQEYNQQQEDNYGGVSKRLSLPLPISHNKLKSIIYSQSIYAKYDNSNADYHGYMLIDINTGEIEYKLEPQQVLSNNPELNLLNIIPTREISINSKEEMYVLRSKYFKLLEDLILMYGSKKETIKTDKIEEFVNIYENIECEPVQSEYAFTNDFFTWCIVLAHKPEIEKLEFEKPNIQINETYIDENGHQVDRERTIEIPVFPITDLSKTSENIYNEIEKLPVESEFTIQQFLKDYTIEEKDKFSICNSVFNLCKNNNVIIVEKMPGAALGLPWNIPRIKKGNKNNKELADIIDKKLQEFDDDTANNLRKYILEITEKIINLPNDFETTISKIINYNPESNFVDPLTQGIIFNKVTEICKEIKINLQSTYDKFGGLAFNYTFIKMKENENYVKQQESNDVEITNINKDGDIKKTEVCYICYYDFVPYKQIGPIRLNVDDKENYEETGVRHINNNGINHALCKALFIDSPEVIKRNKNTKDEVYITCNGIKIKLTCYYNTFIEELRNICDDIKTIKIPDDTYTLTVSEQLGIIITAENIDNQFLIRYISFCGKDVFLKKINIYKEANNF